MSITAPRGSQPNTHPSPANRDDELERDYAAQRVEEGCGLRTVRLARSAQERNNAHGHRLAGAAGEVREEQICCRVFAF